MKPIKAIFVGTLITGLLLVSANGALAAYSGKYVNENDSTEYVDFYGASSAGGSFTINGGSNYDISSGGTTSFGGELWSASGANYFYGGNLDKDFAFIQSGKSLAGIDLSGIAGQVSGFVATAQINFALVGILYTYEQAMKVTLGALESMVDGWAKSLGYDPEISLIGYGTFADDGLSFDVTTGTLDADGLKSMLCENCTETFRATPIPGAVWLLGSGLLGLVGLKRRRRS